MKLRHELWKNNYPDSVRAHAVAFTGLANARPETKALSNPLANFKDLPFDMFLNILNTICLTMVSIRTWGNRAHGCKKIPPHASET